MLREQVSGRLCRADQSPARDLTGEPHGGRSFVADNVDLGSRVRMLLLGALLLLLALPSHGQDTTQGPPLPKGACAGWMAGVPGHNGTPGRDGRDGIRGEKGEKGDPGKNKAFGIFHHRLLPGRGRLQKPREGNSY